jgi:plasmid stabilization system protein ParE
MNKVVLSPEARNDLIDIEKYITDSIGSPAAAKSTLSKIIKTIRKLENFANIGAPLSSIVDIATDYRYLVCENYIAFYRVESEFGTNKIVVYIDRILYKKRDYINILFGKK